MAVFCSSQQRRGGVCMYVLCLFVVSASIDGPIVVSVFFQRFV